MFEKRWKREKEQSSFVFWKWKLHIEKNCIFPLSIFNFGIWTHQVFPFTLNVHDVYWKIKANFIYLIIKYSIFFCIIKIYYFVLFFVFFIYPKIHSIQGIRATHGRRLLNEVFGMNINGNFEDSIQGSIIWKYVPQSSNS